MHKLVFALRVLAGMTWHGIKASPDKVLSRKHSVSDIAFLVGLGLFCVFESYASTVHVYDHLFLSIIMAGLFGCVLVMLIRSKRGSPLSYKRDLLEARNAQIQRMYPSQHARMEALRRKLH